MAKFRRFTNCYTARISAERLGVVLTDRKVAKAVKLLQQIGREERKVIPTECGNLKNCSILTVTGEPGWSGPCRLMTPVSHQLRGMTGVMQDMFRQPDKLLELIDFVLKETMEKTPLVPDENGEIRVFMTNTRGSDDFISKKQYDKFYWPWFKKLVTYLCNHGATPYIFFEGNCISRMEGLLELPKGKFVCRLDTTDIFKAKDILKGHCCIEGNVPSSLLQVGSKDDVIAYCKKLIDYVGKDGGYILAPRSSLDEVKPENFKAMIDFVKEYGVYR